MTEFNISPRNEFDPIRSEQDRQALEVASDDLRALLLSKGVDPKDVMLRGFNAQFPQSATEHVVDEEHSLLHLGTVEDTRPSTYSGPGDQEQQEEAWMVNPFKYAIEGGSLEVFSREKLTALPHEVDKDGFGTIIVTATDKEMHKATVLRSSIDVIRNPMTLRMSESDYHLLWNARPEDAEAAFGVKPDTGIIKIEVEATDGSTHMVYMDTVKHDFGVHVSNVIEVGRPVESIHQEVEEVQPVEDILKDESTEDAESKTSLIESSVRLSAELDKVDAVTTALDTLVQTDSAITHRFNDLYNMWNSAKYSLSNHDSEALAQGIYALQADIAGMGHIAESIRPTTQTISEQCDVLRTEVVRFEQENDSDLLRISRNTEESSTELTSSVSGATHRINEGLSDSLSRIITDIHNMANDTYGMEAYVSSIDHAMKEIDSYFREGGAARGYLIRAQDAAVELRSLRMQLNEL